MTLLNFNANDHDPSQGGGICFPLADYKVEIINAEAKQTKDTASGNGFLELSLMVMEGDYRGQVQIDRLNIYNSNPVAVQIAHKQLSAYAWSMNRPFLQDTNDMIGGKLIATIGPQDSNPKYSEVKVVKCMDGSLPQRQPQQAQAQAAPQAPPQAPQAPQAPPPQPQQPQVAQAVAAPAWAPQPTTAAPQLTTATGSTPPWANSGTTPGQLPPWAK